MPVYVKNDAIGLNDGSSWSNAYISLRTAITNASANDELWVAKGSGVYSEASGTECFIINKNLYLYGGFIGTETLRSQRDPEITKQF